MFYLKMNIFFERAQKVTKYFGYFERKDVAKNFQKTPNPVTLPPQALYLGISLSFEVYILSLTHTHPSAFPYENTLSLSHVL